MISETGRQELIATGQFFENRDEAIDYAKSRKYAAPCKFKHVVYNMANDLFFVLAGGVALDTDLHITKDEIVTVTMGN